MFDFIRKYGLLTIIVIGLIITIFIMNNRDQVKDEEINDIEIMKLKNELEIAELQNEEVDEEKWFVDVKGEVMRPGLYEVEKNYRIKNVIDLAGGFTENAAEEIINLAQKVSDEMVIYVPKIGEENDAFIELGSSSTNDPNKIKVNEATAEDLTKLNGIGPAKAEAIITYREENGPFKEIDDLLQVSGIGEKTLENIREDIIIP